MTTDLADAEEEKWSVGKDVGMKQTSNNIMGSAGRTCV